MAFPVQISASQAQKEVTANEALVALAPSGLYARKYTTTTGLTWGYYGGILTGTYTVIADGAIALTDTATNYIEADISTGVVSKNTSGFTAGKYRLYSAVCAAGAISSYIDYRASQNTSNVPDNLVVPKTTNKGIMVDNAAPTFPWRAVEKDIKIAVAGANDPTWGVYRASGAITVSQFQFSNAAINEVFLNYRMPHDYVPGTDLTLNAQWSQIVVDTGGAASAPGACQWNFDLAYAKAFGTAGAAADAFAAPITTNATQQGSTTQYGHMTAAVVISSAGGDSTHIANTRFEAGGMLIVRVWRDASLAGDTLNQVPYLHSVDMSYQSTNVGTKQNAPPLFT